LRVVFERAMPFGQWLFFMHRNSKTSFSINDYRRIFKKSNTSSVFETPKMFALLFSVTRIVLYRLL